jgi:hypothetical protein
MPERLTREGIVRSGRVRARAAFHGTCSQADIRFRSAVIGQKPRAGTRNHPAALPNLPPGIYDEVMVGGGNSRHRG